MKHIKPIFPSLEGLESGLEIMKGGYKMKQSRKVLAVLLALVMVITMIPQNALAAKNKSKKKKYTVEISYVYSNGTKAAKTVKKSYPVGKKKVKATVNVPKKKGFTATMTRKETKKAKKLFTKFQFNGKKIKYQLKKAKKNIKIQVVYVKNKTEKTTKAKEPTKPAEEDTSAAPEEGYQTSGSFSEAMGTTFVDVNVPKGAFDVPVKLKLGKVGSADEQTFRNQIDGDIVDMALVDISFIDQKGKELEPAKKIDVSIETNDLKKADNYTLYHLNNGVVEEVTPPELEEVSKDSAAFSSDQFSAYAIVAKSATLLAADDLGDGDVSGPPDTEKKLTPNGDGTYTLSLSVTGATESSSTENVEKLNVVLVIDVSGSMAEKTNNETESYTYSSTTYNQNTHYYGTVNGNETRVYRSNNSWIYSNGYNYSYYTGTVYVYKNTRLSDTQKAACTLVDQLLALNTLAHPDMMQITLVTFANKTAVTASGYNGTTAPVRSSSNATNLKNAINGLKPGGGTNWEAALQLAKTEADALKGTSDEATSVIFLTDGVPTFYGSDQGYGNQAGQEETNNIHLCWNNADDDARTIVSSGYNLYNIFAYGQGSDYLSALTNYAYTGSGTYNDTGTQTYTDGTKTTDYFYDASDTAALVEAFDAIIQKITNDVGYTNVELEDGVTSMTSTSISASTEGTVTGFKYYRSGGSYGEADPDNNDYGTEWTDAPEATINSDGNVDWDLDDLVLEDGVTYTITFVVWPSQASLDMVADLNNGIKDYDSLTPAQKESIIKTGNVYTLKTNTDYPSVTYSTITTTTIDGESATVISDPVSADIVNPEPVSLAGSQMSVQKIWASELQSSRLNEVLYNEDGSSKKLKVTLDILSGNNVYDTVTLGWDDEANDYAWVDADKTTWRESFAVAPGVMVTNEDYKDYAKSTVTYGGKTYYILETGHEYLLQENDFKDYHFDLITEVYHPMLVDGVLKSVKFTYSGSTMTGIESMTPETEELSSLDATNTLRGGINLNKIVVDKDDKETQIDEEFEFTIKLVNDNEVFTGDSIPWYGVNGNYYHDDEGNYISEAEAIEKYGEDGAAAHGNILSGNSTSVSGTISITSADTVRIANVPVGTTYTITETSKDGFELKQIDQYTQLYDGSERKPGTGTVTLADGKIVGEIVPNRENNITYTNKVKGDPYFYVYHSKDNTVEKISVFDERVETATFTNNKWTCTGFDIVKETKADCLYGGYYEDYPKKGSGYDSATQEYDENNWSTDVKEGVTPYTGDPEIWKSDDAYTVNGFSMNPEQAETYYLKEVPDTYLRIGHFETFNNYEIHDNCYLYNLHLLSAVDDNNYRAAGFDDYATLVDKDGQSTATHWQGKLYEKVTVTYPGIDPPEAEYIPEIVLSDIAGMSDSSKGFILMAPHKKTYDVGDEEGSKLDDESYNFVPYFITPDYVKVNGIRIKNIALKDNVDDGDGHINATCSKNHGLTSEITTVLYKFSQTRKYIKDFISNYTPITEF